MELYFLGTSSGVPTKTRNVTALGIIESVGNAWYLVDCGEGTQHQILQTNLSLNSLEAILITHVHGDHCYGLPGLLASAGMSGRKKPLKIIAPKGIKEWFQSTQQHTQLFLPFDLEFIESTDGLKHAFHQFSISLVALSHRVESYAYVFTERNVQANLDVDKLKALGIPQGPLWGQLKQGKSIEFDGTLLHGTDFVKHENKARKVIVCGDNDSPDLLIDACDQCDVLVHEATYTEEEAEKAGKVGHSYAKQVAKFSEENSVPNLILTHFSPRYQSSPDRTPSMLDLKKEALTEYSGHLHLAEDFQVFQLDKMCRLAPVNG